MAIIKVGDKATAPSIRPSLNLDFANSKSLDPRASFTRSSTATYYDGSTNVKAEENLFFWSENGNDSWGNLNTVETPNSTGSRAPDGTYTTTKFAEQSSNIYPAQGVRFFSPPVVNGRTFTFSIYVKGIGRDKFSIDNSDFREVWYDTASLSVQNPSGIAGASISAIGDGWYRLTYTSSSWSTSFIDVCVADTMGTNGVNPRIDGNGMYAWGAQLEERSQATTYVKTAGSPHIRYQSVLQTAPANQPRFDHDPITNESKGLYLETSGRTNLLIRSSEFSDSIWNRNNFGNWRFSGHTENFAIAPDGTLTADTYESTITIQTLTQRVNCSPSTEYTFSCWIKATRLSTAHLNIIASTGDSSGTLIDYPTEFVGDRDDRLNDYNDWTRVSYTFTTPSNAAFIEVGLTSGYDIPANRNAPLNQWLVWGAQLEQGNYVSSYIPTDTATVTRSGENCQVAIDSNSDWYAKGKGTLYVEGAVNGFVTSQGLAGFRDSSDAGATWNGVYSSSAGQIIASNYSTKYGGNQGGNLGTSGGFIGLGEFSRTAMSFSHEYGASAISKDENVEVFSGVYTNMSIPEHDFLYVGRLGSSYAIQNGHVKKVAYYPETLDVDELKALVEE